jgi:hypothetical protein
LPIQPWVSWSASIAEDGWMWPSTSRHDGGAAGVEHAVGRDRLRRIECGNFSVAHEQRADLRLRPREVAGEESADVLDEQARQRGPRAGERFSR